MTTRTEELEQGGARRIGGGGSSPFIKWGDSYGFVEGSLEEIWEGKHGDVATIEVAAADGELYGQEGQGQPPVDVVPGMRVNVGLNYAALNGVTDDLVGSVVHVAFVQWAETKEGQQYREFRVYEVKPGEEKEPSSVTDDDIPF